MTMDLRWSDYFIDRDFGRFWTGRLADADASACVILGSGFDPRAVLALKRFEEVSDPARLGYVAFRFPPPRPVGEHTRTLAALSETNSKFLDEARSTCIVNKPVELYDDSGHTTGGREVLNSIHGVMARIGTYRDVVVDISGMPRTIFFPLLAYLCREADAGRLQNLHVSVSESPSVDAAVNGLEYGAADYVHPFRLGTRQRLVWLPVVGKNESIRLQKVYELLKNDCIEICPVLPFPSSTLRHADDILMSLREVLFENLAISEDNLILCDERNPFDTYRKVLQIHDYYRERVARLPALEDVTSVLSPPSSKMLSLGILLAAIERRLPVCHVGARAYTITGDPRDSGVDMTKMTEIWLTGEPYTIEGG